MSHLRKYWCIPPKQNAIRFVACMENMLEVYARPTTYNAQYPVVCMDETSKQLTGEVEDLQPARPSQPKRVEHEYVRNGVAQLFLEVQPLTGRSHVAAGETRTRKEWARWIEGMLTTRYPDADLSTASEILQRTHDPSQLSTSCPTRLRIAVRTRAYSSDPEHRSD